MPPLPRSMVPPVAKAIVPPVSVVVPVPVPLRARRWSVKDAPRSCCEETFPPGVMPVRNSSLVSALETGATPRFQLAAPLQVPPSGCVQTKDGTEPLLLGSVPARNSAALVAPSPSGSAFGPMMLVSVTPGQLVACQVQSLRGAWTP